MLNYYVGSLLYTIRSNNRAYATDCWTDWSVKHSSVSLIFLFLFEHDVCCTCNNTWWSSSRIRSSASLSNYPAIVDFYRCKMCGGIHILCMYMICMHACMFMCTIYMFIHIVCICVILQRHNYRRHFREWSVWGVSQIRYLCNLSSGTFKCCALASQSGAGITWNIQFSLCSTSGYYVHSAVSD